MPNGVIPPEEIVIPKQDPPTETPVEVVKSADELKMEARAAAVMEPVPYAQTKILQEANGEKGEYITLLLQNGTVIFATSQTLTNGGAVAGVNEEVEAADESELWEVAKRRMAARIAARAKA